MSGDFGPRITIPAALIYAQGAPDVQIQLYGDPDLIRGAAQGPLPANVTVHPSETVVPMDADPRQALRQGAGSSMWRSLEALASGDANACVSAGNSGALLLISRRVVGGIEGVEVPAFCKAMPVESGHTLMLDLGANLHCSSAQLLQFARMGHILAESAGVRSPRVGLLNIGSEAGKGTKIIRDAAELMGACNELNFCGYVEADSIYTGVVEVIVCDGFSGNIALKTSEGVARLISRRIEKSFSSGWGRLGGLLMWPILRRWRAELNPDAYNGAVLAGLAGTVIKSHGGAGIAATVNALSLACEQARLGVPTRITRALTSG